MNLSVRFEKTHFIKSVNPSFEDMLAGKKDFEILFDPTLNAYHPEDKIVFEEQVFNSMYREIKHTMMPSGRSIKCKIKYVFYSDNMLTGFVVVRFEKLDS